MRKNLPELASPALFEAAFVVLGVVLALAANEWREKRHELYRTGVQGVTSNYRNLGGLMGAFLYRERQMTAVFDSTLALTR